MLFRSRYPDLFIHRVISEYFASTDKQKERFAEKAPKYAKNSSEREKVAQKVEREAESMKKAEFMEDKIGNVYDGIVSSVTNFGIFVELESTVEGLIRFENLGDEYFIYNESNRTLIGEKSNKIYKIGDKIKLKEKGSLVNVAPTILDYMDIAIPKEMEGTDRKSVV